MEHMRRAIEVLLPVSLFSFLLSYYCYSCLPWYVHSITSLLHSLNHHFTTRRALMFLLAHAILLFLTKTSSAATSVNSTTLSYQFPTRGDHGADHHPALRFLQLADDSLDVELEESAVPLDLRSTADQQLLSGPSPLESADEEVVEENKALEAGSTVVGCLAVVAVVEEEEEKEEEAYAEAEGTGLVIADELDLLDIDDLNKRFDEFIQREKRKMRIEALQVILV